MVPMKSTTAPGPDGKPDGAYEFSGTVNSYIEFSNGGGLDVENSRSQCSAGCTQVAKMALFSTIGTVEVGEGICGWCGVNFLFNSPKETTHRHSPWFTLL